MKFHAGTSGYAFREWKGKFYPEKISPGEMLRFYSARLNTVEINNTFYQMPKAGVLASWAEQVPDDFVFAIKAPQIITHLKQLRNVASETDYFFRSLSVLDGKLGPVLFQLPGSFHADKRVLEQFLDLIPETLLCAFEFRSPTWLDGNILNLLQERGCSLCITDSDDKPAVQMNRTAPWGYLRLRRSDYSDDDLALWIERILEQKWERTFVFFKHEQDARGPRLALRFDQFAHPKEKKLFA